jgi:hypothetical protein
MPTQRRPDLTFECQMVYSPYPNMIQYRPEIESEGAITDPNVLD